jgi:hypothetical protein
MALHLAFKSYQSLIGLMSLAQRYRVYKSNVTASIALCAKSIAGLQVFKTNVEGSAYQYSFVCEVYLAHRLPIVRIFFLSMS